MRWMPFVLGVALISPVTLAQAPANNVIEEVIVTVTKRAESVQDVSASVNAYGGALADDFNIDDADKIGEILPNINVRNQSNITIRGIGRGLTNGSPVATHENGFFVQDGVTIPYYDIAAIEVLRGPAGTVYGRNATGGALNVKWREPEDEWSGSVDTRRAANDQREERAWLNIPISEKMAARIALYHNERDGLYDDLLHDGIDDPNGILERMARVFWRYDINDNSTLKVRYVEVSKSKNYFIASPREETRASGILEELGAQPLPVDDLRIVRSTVQRFGEPEQERHQLDIEWSLSLPELPLVGPVDVNALIGEYRRHHHEIIDLDGTEVAILDTDSDLDQRNTSGEIRFSSAGDGAFQWILGFFYLEHEETGLRQIEIRQKIDLSAAAPGFPPGTEVIAEVEGDSYLDTISSSEAVFFSGEFSIQQWLNRGPNLELFGGLRENRDNFIKRDRTRLVLTSAEDPTTGVAVPIPGGQAEISNVQADFDQDFSELTGELGIRWYFGENEDSMAYFKYAKGYKPGFAEQLDSGELNILKPEILNAYEMGYKTRLWDGRITLNTALFYYDYQDLQVQQFIGTTLFTENAANSTIQGFEMDMVVRPLDGLTLQFALGMLDTNYDEFCSHDPFRPQQTTDAECGGDTPQSLAGNDLSDSPPLTVSLLLQYDLMLDNGSRVTPSIKTSWKDDFYTRQFNLDEDRISAFSKTDARVAWVSPEQRYHFEIFVENLENEDQIFLNPVFFGQAGAISALTYRPGRNIGASVGISF